MSTNLEAPLPILEALETGCQTLGDKELCTCSETLPVFFYYCFFLLLPHRYKTGALRNEPQPFSAANRNW